MRRTFVLSALLVLLISFFAFSQFPVVKDERLSYCFNKLTTNSKFNISPTNEWILECKSYYDSAELYMFRGLDTLNKIKIITFHKRLPTGGVNVDIQDYIIDFDQQVTKFTHNTWSNNLDTIYVSVRGSPLNSQDYNWEGFAIDVSSITSIDFNNDKIIAYSKRIRAKNKPNPFNISTVIQYTTPISGYVVINIYNSDGKIIRALEQEYRKTGIHSTKWDGKDNKGNKAASGRYYYQVISGNHITTKKMILLK
jgi:hypothetical protein